MKKNSTFFATGEFAKLCNTTKDTLFHYDQVGVLKPEITKDNGYRYYTVNQIYLFNMIRILRDCGCSIPEIKSFIDMEDPQGIAGFVSEKKADLVSQREKLNQAILFMDHVLELTDPAEVTEPLTAHLMDLPEAYMAITPTESSQRITTRESASLLHKHFDLCENDLHISRFPIGRIVMKETIFSGELFYSYLYSEFPEPHAETERIMVRPAGTYACITHQGSYANLSYAYQILLNFIDRNGLHITGNAYEKETISYILTQDSDNFIIEIMIQVSQ